MKKIISLTIVLVTLLACQTSNKKTVFTCNEEEVIVKICVNTKKSELDSIQKVLKEQKNISFDFQQTVFNSDQTIDVLDFVVKGPEGYTCHNNTELYMSDEYQGFYRDYRKGAPIPFRCGLMEK